MISGTPTTVGTYPFTVQVADSQTPPATASAPLSITVNATLTQLTVVTTSLPVGTQNTGYNAMLAATGGVTPYTWSITAGSLPRGLQLNTSTGAITRHAQRRRHFQLHGAGDGLELAGCDRQCAPQHHHYTGGAVEHHHDLATVRH